MLFLTFAVAGKRASSERISRRKWKHPTPPFGFAGWCGSCSWGRSTTNAFDDLGKPIAGVGKAVELVLALAAAVYDSPCRNRARWWLRAGWLMLNWSPSPPTWHPLRRAV